MIISDFTLETTCRVMHCSVAMSSLGSTVVCLWPVHLCSSSVVLINSCDYILMVTLRLPPTEIIRRCYAIMSRDKAIIFCRLTSCCSRVMSRTLSLSSAFSGTILSPAPRQPRLSSLMMRRFSPPTPSRPAPS